MNEQTAQALFYINLALAFFAFIELIALVVLCKKTAFMRIFGAVVSSLTGLGVVLVFVQLVLKAGGFAGANDAVLAAFVLELLFFFAGGAYCGVLAVRSNKKRCISAAVLHVIPPVGAIAAVVLAKKLKADTRAQKLVFTGCAYTFAACNEFSDTHKFDYIDSADVEKFEPLDKKALKAKLKELKRNAKTPEGKFEYGAALFNYTSKTKKAVKLFVKAAKSDYPPALFNLGLCRETGTALKKDVLKARELYKRASAKGDVDAPMRLAVLDMKSTGKNQTKAAGVAFFLSNMNASDCAKFDYALALEKGDGAARDEDKALELYTECVRNGFFTAEERLFEIMCKSVDTHESDELFKKVALIKFDGALELVMSAMIAVKEKRASDAADLFLEAVKLRGRWEGISRLLLGTLYMDCGKTEADRKNGEEYVKTAASMTPIAANLYSSIRAAKIGRSEKKIDEARKQKPVISAGDKDNEG